MRPFGDDTSSTVLKRETLLRDMNLRKQLRFYLDQRSWTAASLAKKSRVPKASLSGWMAGKSPRDIEQLKRVCDVLDVSLDNLLFGDGPSKENENLQGIAAALVDGDGWISGQFEIKLRRIKK
jgi:transcriptional regulator with XRE-family HTH domain